MFCSFFNEEVDLTAERERHIENRHPEVLPKHRRLIDEVLLDPEAIYQDIATGSHLFTKRYPDWLNGKLLVVVVIRDTDRTWVVTAYVARKVTTGRLIWKKQD